MSITAYPAAAPSVSGANITVSQFIQQPTRVTRYLSDLSLRGYFTQRVFSTPGGVTGGAVVYDQLTLNDLFSNRDVQNVEPGAEFPVVTSDNPTPLTARVEKFGGKFFVTDEARDRNDLGVIQREGRKLFNTMMMKMDAKTVALLDASITANSATQVIAGNNWNNVVTAGSSASTASAYPAADFSKVLLKAEQAELGAQPTLWIVNPAQKAQFNLIYGPGAQQVLAAYDIEMLSSNRVAAGTAYVVEPGQTGEIRFEKPMSTETWREAETQRTWFQTDVRPVMYVTNPFSAFKVTGLQ